VRGLMTSLFGLVRVLTECLLNLHVTSAEGQ
jgi:hypothetical protein